MISACMARPVRASMSILMAVGVLAGTSAAAAPASQQAGFADPAFQRVWQRTDLPVANGTVSRTWFWGPKPGEARQEAYQKSPSGPVRPRLVQYFDKARMEINDTTVDRSSPWYVTSGLLTVELVSGQAQGFQKETPEMPLASDLDDASAPTYRSFRSVSDVPGNSGHAAKSAVGQAVTSTIDRAGTVGSDASKSAFGPAVQYAYYEPATQHNVVRAFWDFLHSTDIVYEGGQTKLRLLSDPWFYATGLPISEAYWAKVRIAGQPRDVLIQAFQRRVLTYVPDNPAGWRVQMGNIGQHYFSWRYGEGQPSPAPTPQGKPTGRIVFASDRGGSGPGIYTMAADGSDVRQVAKTAGSNYAPRYAFNGELIAYTNAPGAGGPAPDAPTLVMGSRIMFTSDRPDADGAPMGATSVPHWDAQSDPAYDPRGMLLVFRGKPAGEAPGLFVANLASDAIVIPVRRLTTGEWDRQPVWSPDGNQIAFTSGTAADNSQVWLMSADGTNKRRTGDVVAGIHDADPAWSPDSKKLIFASDRATGKYDLVTMAGDGTLGPALTGGEGTNQRHPAYSADGQWITFSSDKGGNWEVYAAPSDASTWTNVSRSAGSDVQPSWGGK